MPLYRVHSKTTFEGVSFVEAESQVDALTLLEDADCLELFETHNEVDATVIDALASVSEPVATELSNSGVFLDHEPFWVEIEDYNFVREQS